MSLEQNFQNMRKVSSQMFAMIIWSKFHKFRPEIVVFRDPDRHTHPDTCTDRARSGLRYSVILK